MGTKDVWNHTGGGSLRVRQPLSSAADDGIGLGGWYVKQQEEVFVLEAGGMRRRLLQAPSVCWGLLLVLMTAWPR